MMDMTRTELETTYRDKDNDELLKIHKRGTLVELAYEILEEEMSRRSMEVPDRSETPHISTVHYQSLRDHWEGRARLVSAFWLLGVLGSLIVIFLGGVFDTFYVNNLQNRETQRNLETAIGLVQLTYAIFALVSISRCGLNVNWKGWRNFSRAFVVLYCVLIYLYIMIKNA